MNHCLLITAYKDVEQINRIIEYTPKEWGIYIHLDSKSIINKDKISSHAHVYKKLNVKWGGVEHLKAFIFLLQQAYDDNAKFDYYHFITGQDFYSINPVDFDKVLGKDGNSYFEVHPCPRENWWGGGFEIIKFRTISSYFDIRNNRIAKLINTLYRQLQRILNLTRPLPDYPLFCGSVYGSIHESAVNFILNSEIAKDLLNRLKDSTCGEEIYFQTILMNSLFANKIINDNLRYIDWNVCSPPKFLNEEDYERIISSRTLFCRKIDSYISSKLLNMLIRFIFNNNEQIK